MLSLGLLSQAELAGLKNPSMAGVLQTVVGDWGAALISIGLIVSVAGALLAWTLLGAESLFTPAKAGVMPASMASENGQGTPSLALWVTNGCVQLFLLLTLFSSATYLALISLATSMILLPYLFSALYAVKSVWRREGYSGRPSLHWPDMSVAVLASLYCVWLLYAAGPKYLLLSALLYAPGSLIYLATARGKGLSLNLFERGLLLLVWCGALAAGWMLWTGALSL